MSFGVDEQSPTDISFGNAEAERSLLCELLHDNRLVDEMADQCRTVDFSDRLYGRVYAAIVEQCAKGQRVDAITLIPIFRDDADWIDRKLLNILSAAELNARGPAAARGYGTQIVDLARRRRLATGLRTAIGNARDLAYPTTELVVEIDEAMAEIGDRGAQIEQESAGTYAQVAIDSFGEDVSGVRCGVIGSLDDTMGDLRPGSMTVVAGRPGMAKTTTACSYALGAAARGHGVLLISLEMSADELIRRILADLCHRRHLGGVPYELIRDGRVVGDELARVRAAKRRLDALPFEIAEPPGLTLARLRRLVRRQKRRFAVTGQSLDLVVLDYLQLLKPARAGTSPYEHASDVSRGLKEISREEGLAVMAVAQLNRDVEKRPDKRPMASDLRDSGQIEQDADAIVLLFREAYYAALEEPEDRQSTAHAEWRDAFEVVRDRIEFIVPKRRNGPPGKAMGYFFGATQAVRGNDYYRLGDGEQHG